MFQLFIGLIQKECSELDRQIGEFANRMESAKAVSLILGRMSGMDSAAVSLKEELQNLEREQVKLKQMKSRLEEIASYYIKCDKIIISEYERQDALNRMKRRK